MPLLQREMRAGNQDRGHGIAATVRRVAQNGQRIRLGITGLAAIFLIVLIAAAGMRPVRSVAPAGAQGDPLATLGVAPSSAHEAARRADSPPVRPTRI